MFQLKTKIVFGRGCIEGETEKLKGNKAIIFSSNSMKKFGFLEEITNSINMGYKIITGIKSEPEEKDIMDYTKFLNEYKPDVIIAMGGGSVIDAAKASLYHYKNAYMVAIPSTSGSGSEVTMASVLARNGLKYSIVAEHLAPKIAILDPRLPEKMPSWLAAYTGMDALSHAIESYVSKISSPFSRAMSIRAIKIIFEWLFESVRGNRSAREKIHYASCMAGIAILNARVGLCHAMAHKLGVFGIPHGLAIALLLDATIEFNMKNEEARKKYDAIAMELGFKNGKGLLQKLKELKEDIGIRDMASYIDENEFMKKLDLMANEAAKDVLLRFNPVKPDIKEIKEIYEKAYYGKKSP